MRMALPTSELQAKTVAPIPGSSYLAFVFVYLVFGSLCNGSTLESPDGAIRIQAGLKDRDDGGSEIAYQVFFDGQQVIDESSISFLLGTGQVVGHNVRLKSEPSEDSYDSTWKPLYGERSTIRDHYNQLSLELLDKTSGYGMQVTFRCYDSGVAFRTVLRAPTADSLIQLSAERSEFRFIEDHTAWCTIRTQGEHGRLQISKMSEEVERPLTIQLDEHLYAAITEANVVDYATMRLSRLHDDPLCLVTRIHSDVETNGTLKAPWRVIMLGRSPGELLENNDIALNLSEPCAIEDTSWIKPGKVIREITLTTDGGKACVDFAAKHNLQYVEFDAGWYGNEYSDESDATTVTVDERRSKGPLDLPYIIDYAAKRDIGIIVYVNRRALEKQLDEILPLYQKWGIKGVKYGFVQTGSQQWTNWLHDAVRKAAEHRLMVDIHDQYRPVGYTRTYPNLMSQEGVRGDEARPRSDQAVTTLFTRNLAGAADHTICYFAPRVTERWTHGHQLAKAVCTYSPWQFLFWYDTPLESPPPGKHRHPIVDTPELEFFAKIPTVWDETRVIHGEIGKSVIIARRSQDDWFIGAMNSDEDRTFEVPLGFLSKGQEYTTRIYRDDPTMGTLTNVRIEERILDESSFLSINLKPNGGTAIWLTPSQQLAGSGKGQHKASSKHLFILSGQSNMVGLDPSVSFTPYVQAKYGSDNVVVIKDAKGGQPISRWYKDWVSTAGHKPKTTGELYIRLMRKLTPEIEGRKFETVTFVWMQGEADARKQEADVYADSLRGLVRQLSIDLGRADINVVIGRISDYDMNNEDMKHWTRIREAQVEFAEGYTRAVLVNTDDLNDGVNTDGRSIKNDLHYSVEGYKILGQRFAEGAIHLIESSDSTAVGASAVRR